MRLTKYDGVSNPALKAVLGSLGGGENSSDDVNSRGEEFELNRTIWGQKDEGDDVDGSMVVNGNVSIKVIVPPQYDPDEGDPEDDDEDGEDIEEETGGGNLDVELKITAKQAEFKEAKYASDYNLPATDNSTKFASTEWVKKAHKTLTIKDSKNNELGKFNNSEDKTITVKNYDDEISSLNSRVSTAETNITNISNHQTDQDVMINANVAEILDLKKRTGTNEGDITNIYQMIEDINKDIETVTGEVPTKVSQLENDAHYITLDDLPEADYKTPVILYSGTFVSDNNDGDKTWQPWKFGTYAFNAKVSSAGVGYAYDEDDNRIPSIEINLYPKTGYSVKALSVSAMVTKATDYNVFTSAAGGNPRSKGYWCTGGVGENGRIYIGAWRTQDDNNDSVRWDCLGYKCQEISVTIYGTISKNE